MKRILYKPRTSKWKEIKKLLDKQWRVLDIALELKTSPNAIYAYMKRNSYQRNENTETKKD
jgi:hypothetical protein